MSLLQLILSHIFVLLLVLILIIFLIRITFKILFYYAKKHYYKRKRLKLKKEKEKEKKFTPPTDEVISFAKNIAKEQEIVQQQERELDFSEDRKIVGIVKPVGKWTSLILGQKMGYLLESARIMNELNGGGKGFWVNMIEAQERMPGMKRGRGI